jgi:serine/threonine protein phosphatase PrpC
VLERSASAEQAARRLANRANQAGADDNVTVVVVRAC